MSDGPQGGEATVGRGPVLRYCRVCENGAVEWCVKGKG